MSACMPSSRPAIQSHRLIQQRRTIPLRSAVNDAALKCACIQASLHGQDQAVEQTATRGDSNLTQLMWVRPPHFTVACSSQKLQLCHQLKAGHLPATVRQRTDTDGVTHVLCLYTFSIFEGARTGSG